MFWDSFCRVFKYKYLKGKPNKRVDKYLLDLIKFNKEKIFERFSKLAKGKYSSRMRYNKESHEASKRMLFNNVEVINEKNFNNKSQEGAKLYDVSEVKERCTVNSCKMVSPDCEISSHEYTCTCVDLLLRRYICKHIHLVAQCLPKKKHSSGPETNFPDYDNENISTKIILKSEHPEKENGNFNAIYKVNLPGNMASSSRKIADFQCVKSKSEGYALELLNLIKKFHRF